MAADLRRTAHGREAPVRPRTPPAAPKLTQAPEAAHERKSGMAAAGAVCSTSATTTAAAQAHRAGDARSGRLLAGRHAQLGPQQQTPRTGRAGRLFQLQYPGAKRRG